MRILPSLFSPTPHISDAFTAIDLGTSRVKVGVFSLDESSVTLLSSGDSHHVGDHILLGAVSDGKAVLENVKTALENAAGNGTEIPKQVIFGISGENLYGTTAVVRLTRPNSSVLITEAEIERLREEVEINALRRASEHFAKENSFASPEVVGSKVTNILVDGDISSDPVGLSGRQIEMYNFSMFTTAMQTQSIQILCSQLKMKLVTVSSTMYALVESLNAKPADITALIIDVGGETTEIAVIYNGGITELRHISIGGESITRTLANGFGIEIEEAEQLKVSGNWKKIQEDASDSLKEALSNTFELWISGITMVLQECSQIKTLPSSVYLTGGGALAPGFKEVLTTSPWARELPFLSFPKTRLVELSDLGGLRVQSGTIQISQNTGLLGLGFVGIQIKQQI